MAPLENGGFQQQSAWDEAGRHRVDSLMRALLYIAQQVGRPVSEADIRRLTAVPATGLDEAAFLSAGGRLGLESEAIDLASRSLDELPLPFALLAADGGVHVVVSGRADTWTILDVGVGRARTGCGKTLAFVLPIVERLAGIEGGGSKRAYGRAPSVVVLAPTRELAKQVAADFEHFAAAFALTSVCLYGGTPYSPQEGMLRRGVDVVIGTPGRVKDHLERGTLKLQ